METNAPVRTAHLAQTGVGEWRSAATPTTTSRGCDGGDDHPSGRSSGKCDPTHSPRTEITCSALANPFRKRAKCDVTAIAAQWVSYDVRDGHLSAKQNTDASAA